MSGYHSHSNRGLAGPPPSLGATWDGAGITFCVFAAGATSVELCLFGDPAGAQQTRLPLRWTDGDVWQLSVPGIGPGQVYGYRAYGPYDPSRGARFNPHKLLLDPYCRAVAGSLAWGRAVFDHDLARAPAELVPDARDSASAVPRGVVIDPAFDWQGDRPPYTPRNETVVYEAHVRGLTVLHPDVPAELRGRYLGVSSPPILEHLLRLGVTAIELMPVQHFVDEHFLVERSLINYWGYNPLGLFAPAARFASGDRGQQVTEFKEMVRQLHTVGVEVILDVVYNHTAEGNHLGPTLSLRGLANPVYYRLHPQKPHTYLDFTGTGNALNVHQAQTLKLIADSLRYWVSEMHVDGFRFDLAIALAREPHGYDKGAGFFDILHQDPVLSRVKLIAEPWDLGDYGYQLGNLPVLWSEWNGKYRDTVRRFWRGDRGEVAELAYRLSGSTDLYKLSGRPPTASINFVTAHDGFTLHDLVSYNDKHNEVNCEDNQDGTTENLSWNCGAEGPTDKPEVNALRARQQRNLLATLLLSQGVPLLLGGDELGRTQHGNNNAYCQDNALSWIDWTMDTERGELLNFVYGMLKIRREHPILRRRQFLDGCVLPGSGLKDVAWLRPDGHELDDANWADAELRCLGMRLAGDAASVDDEGTPDRTLLVLLNAGSNPVAFVLPPAGAGAAAWEVLVQTVSESAGSADAHGLAAGERYGLAAHALALLGASPA